MIWYNKTDKRYTDLSLMPLLEVDGEEIKKVKTWKFLTLSKLLKKILMLLLQIKPEKNSHKLKKIR